VLVFAGGLHVAAALLFWTFRVGVEEEPAASVEPAALEELAATSEAAPGG
jgi:hypothetical protein